MSWNAMASYRIEWKEIKHIERGTLRRILDAVMSLGVNPRPDGCRKLAGASMTYRIRVGQYRVVYRIEDDCLIVESVRVGHRNSVYRA